MITNQRMTAERCLDWCLLAYATTKATGTFTAYRWNKEIKSSELLLLSAKHAGLVKANAATGKGSIWEGTVPGSIPTLTDAKLLFDQYNRDADASREKARAKKKAREKAEAVANKLPPAPDEHSTVASTPTQLDRIEAKLNLLAKEWNLK